MTLSLEHTAQQAALRLPVPSPMETIYALQVLRFVAVLLVMWVHVVQRTVSSVHFAAPNLGAFGVDIFFVISGYILCSSVLAAQAKGTLSAWTFAKKRLIRIYPIYWVMFLVCSARMYLRGETLDWKYLPSFGLLPLDLAKYPSVVNGSWTLVFEVLFYALLCASVVVSKKHSLSITLLLLCFLVLLGSGLKERNAFSAVACNAILLEFVFGGILAFCRGPMRRLKPYRWVMIAAGFGCCAVVRMLDIPAASGMQMILANNLVGQRVFSYGLSAALIVAGAILFDWKPVSGVGRLGVLLGNASYSTYLFAELPLTYSLGPVRRFLSHSGRTEWFFPLSAACITVSLFCGLLVYWYVEKPMLKRLAWEPKEHKPMLTLRS